MDLMAMFPREHRYKGVLFDYPSLMLAIITSYLAFVLKFGPALMRDRKPIRLIPLVRLYNILQVLANLLFVVNGIDVLWRYWPTGHFNLPCSSPTTSIKSLGTPEDTEYFFNFGKYFFYIKIFDLLDTVFFVLAKKNSHISFLHVFHHTIVATSGYVILRSGWAMTLLHAVAMNAAIHIFMYLYYFLATFPSLRPYLWWKKWLTAVQIVQFIILIIQLSLPILSNCDVPSGVLYYNAAQASVFLILFTRYYVTTYSKMAHDRAQNKRTD